MLDLKSIGVIFVLKVSVETLAKRLLINKQTMLFVYLSVKQIQELLELLNSAKLLVEKLESKQKFRVLLQVNMEFTFTNLVSF